jgi:glycine oxidase
MAMQAAIAGAGLLGRLLALQLARRGYTVDVYDPAPHAEARGAAGWTAAGMLSPVAELECADANVFALGVRSLARWPEIVASLGLPVDFQREGSLLLAHRGDEGAADRVIGLLSAKAPSAHAPQRLDAAQLAALEPSVQGPAHAWLLPNEGRIHTGQAMQALAAAAKGAGARFHWGTRVESVAQGEVRLQDSTQRCDLAVDVRGTGARPQVDVRGVRGEIFWLQAPGLQMRRPLRLLHPRHRVYLVPRAPDLVVVGASEIESEDRSPVSVRTTVELLTAAHSIVPELAEARIVHTETNLRPALPDNLPLVEQSAGLLRINGLFRHGWLIAPALVEDALKGIR